jgi:hypothetical protein
MASWMYNLNGPPPFGIARATLGGPRPGWVDSDRLVPARLLTDGTPRVL